MTSTHPAPAIEPVTQAVSRLLVPLDGTPSSAQALPVAVALAARLRAEVDVVDCLPPTYPTEAEEHWVEEQLRLVGIDRAGKPIVHATLDVVADILATAAAEPRTVVCMASHGRTAVGELVFGSVTHEVIVHSTMPVVVVGPHARVPDTFTTIQICVDGSHASYPVVDIGAAWAHQLHAVPWLTQVVEQASPDGDLLPPGDVVEGAMLSRMAGRVHDAGVQAEWDVLHGHHPADRILAWEREHQPALIVTGSHGRSGVKRLTLGSVTGRLIHEASSPLLIAGPAAVTPA